MTCEHTRPQIWPGLHVGTGCDCDKETETEE